MSHSPPPQHSAVSLLEHAPFAAVLAGADGTVLHLNPAAARLASLPAADAAGRGLAEVLPFLAREPAAGALRRALDEGRAVAVREVRADGGERHELRAVPLDGGVAVYLGPGRAGEDALRASEAEIRALVEAMSDVLLVLDRDGTYRKVAPSAPDRLWRPAGELLGRRLHDVFPPERADEFLELVRRALDTRQRVDAEYSMEIRGETYWFATTISPLPDHDRVVWLARDVTVRHRQEDALRESEEMLRQSQKMEAVGRLAGGIAHDFNNLLTVIRGNAELLLHDLPAGSSQREDAAEVCRASDRAAELTRQLLAFSRRQVVQPRTVSLNHVLGDLDKMLRRIIGEDVELATELGARADTVHVDPGQVKQMVLNLAVNARDALPSGGTIRIATEDVELPAPQGGVPAGRWVALTVADTGCGMDAEVLERIFDPFFTTKEQGKGTGLGLSTVYGIVRQSDGHVTVRSAPGEGSTFRIFLPRAEEGEDAPSGAAAGPAPRSGTGTVLLVEDADGVRAFAARVLARCGYRVIQARDGREALESALGSADPVDLLLTDVVMPEMSGPELARRIRVARPEVAVAYMTGYADEDVVRHGPLPAGPPVLQKPFTAESLAALVQEALSRR